MKNRILAYTIIILLAGYFSSEYANASSLLKDPSTHCSEYRDGYYEKTCDKGMTIWVENGAVWKYCDWRYQIFPTSEGNAQCVYRGAPREVILTPNPFPAPYFR